MRLSPFRRFTSEDYPTAPSWFRTFFDNINPMVDQLNRLLASNIDIDSNLLAERQTVLVQHGVPITIKMNRLTQTPFLVRVGFANGHVGYAAVTNLNADGSVQVTVYFQDAPVAPVSTVLVFEP